MRRTSIKTMVGTVFFFLVYLIGTWSAESFYNSTPHINFGMHMGRPWNHWDFVAFPSLVISVSLLLVSYWFWRKED